MTTACPIRDEVTADGRGLSSSCVELWHAAPECRRRLLATNELFPHGDPWHCPSNGRRHCQWVFLLGLEGQNEMKDVLVNEASLPLKFKCAPVFQILDQTPPVLTSALSSKDLVLT